MHILCYITIGRLLIVRINRGAEEKLQRLEGGDVTGVIG